MGDESVCIDLDLHSAAYLSGRLHVDIDDRPGR